MFTEDNSHCLRRGEKRKIRLQNMAFSFFHVCVCVHVCARVCVQWTSPLVTERAARRCYVAEVHHSHLPVCQMSCLAELHTVMALTKWQEGGVCVWGVWWWRGGGVCVWGGGGTLQWMSIWLQSTASPGALKLPHSKNRGVRESCSLLKGRPTEQDIYIKHTGLRACITTYTSSAPTHA